jgi:Domain of unknown function (DUF4190)
VVPEPLVTSEEVKQCPYCGEMILAAARKCRYCQEYLDPQLRAAAEVPEDLDRFLTPAGRPASAIAAGYLGLFSLLPFFGILAILFGVLALRKLHRNPHLLGRGRAWFGLVMGTIMTLLYAIPLVMIVIEAIDAAHGRRPRF